AGNAAAGAGAAHDPRRTTATPSGSCVPGSGGVVPAAPPHSTGHGLRRRKTGFQSGCGAWRLHPRATSRFATPALMAQDPQQARPRVQQPSERPLQSIAEERRVALRGTAEQARIEAPETRREVRVERVESPEAEVEIEQVASSHGIELLVAQHDGL